MSTSPVDPLGADPRVRAWLGDAYLGVHRFGELLTADGVTRGLIGPREVPRLWERHLLNSAAVAPHLPSGTVADVGSGAGLPGVVVALVRPDVHVILVEPMARRVAWLTEVVAELGLDAEVVRARAEELHGRLLVDGVTARAVAPTVKLAQWTLPLLRRGGVLVALKGEQVEQELADAQDVVARLGGDAGEVFDAASVDGVSPTRLVRIRRLSEPVAQRGPGSDRAAPAHGGRTARGGGRVTGHRGGGRRRAGGPRST